MKKIIFILVLCFCVVSCIQNDRKYHSIIKDQHSQKEIIKNPPYMVVNMVDSLLLKFPNAHSNDIVNKKFIKNLRNELNKKLSANNDYLYEVPLKFIAMLEKSNGKYLIKFECGEYVTNDERLKSDKNKISFCVFAEVNENFASTLEENATYYIKGKYKGFVDNKLILPSGNVCTYTTDYYKFNFNGKYMSENEKLGSVCLGGFLYSNIKVVKTNIN